MKNSINLLPVHIRRRQIIWHICKSWFFLYCFTSMLLAGAAWWTWNKHSEQKIALQTYQLQYAPIKRLEAESRSFVTETQSMQEREKLALQLSNQRSLLSLLGQLSIAAGNCYGNVNINHLSLISDVETIEQKSESKLTLTGIGVDDVAIAQFVAELRDCQMFDHVQLTSSGSTIVEDRESKIYTLECRYR